MGVGSCVGGGCVGVVVVVGGEWVSGCACVRMCVRECVCLCVRESHTDWRTAFS